MKATNTPAVRAISFEELIFAHRNKAYGAFMLRKLYARNISIALALSISIMAAFSALSLYLNRTEDVVPALGPDNNDLVITLQRPPLELERRAVKPAETITAKLRPTVKYIAPVITDDPGAGEELLPTVEDLGNATPSTVTRSGDVDGIDYIPVEPAGPAQTGEGNGPAARIENVVIYAEQMPQYPGGTNELLSFIGRNISYPEIAMRAGIEGKVYVQFVVERDGSLSHMEVIKSIGGGCDEEALRVCRLMQGWVPGMQNGKAVRVRMVIPFQFRLHSK